MNTQYLEFVRQQLMVATADLSGATKGQLVAFAENAMFTATPRSRSRVKVINPANGKLVNPSNPPIPGQQSRAKGSHIPLVQPVEYSTASWRRAVLSLDEHQKAWLLWNYSENVRWENQVTITQWAWSEFRAQLGTKKVVSKTMDRLKALIWLAAQDVKEVLAGRDPYQYGDLAALVGVSKTNWSTNYVENWEAMVRLFTRLDTDSLKQVSRSRSQQKATNCQPSIAEMN
ncbi:antiterminator [Escherichia coli]|nr:antiterminator [Escherichia coli]EFC0518161.1 antiterminator [Escherichia coli]EFC0533308.1 antiterminator [Escherichia coli]EFC0537571.1 antiterminator [Escherichia coli]EFC0573395.1 antiterminator [Escherichia coli]